MASAQASWRSQALGEGKTLELPQGSIRYHDTGSGPTLVFVHGVLINANLWRKVIPRLGPDVRCVSLDLPFGAHTLPMPEQADFSSPALADLVLDTIDALALNDVTLVGNDTGGAFCQIAVTRRPDRIGQLVLTSCDAFENFPPRIVKIVEPLMFLPGGIKAFLAPLRLRPVAKAVNGWLFKKEPEAEVQGSYMAPALESAGVRRDIKKLLRGADKRYTLEAADKLRSFDRPTLIAWSREDKFFPGKYAERLAQTIPNSRLEWIEDSMTFSPEDQPARLAELIGDFVRRPAPAQTH
jgi:pimeloyl-ACP methyl ester carboxylesterase